MPVVFIITLLFFLILPVAAVHTQTFVCVFVFQFAPAGSVRPGDVLQQHPHPSAGLQPPRCAPHTLPPHASGRSPCLSRSVRRSAVHDRDGVPVPTRTLKAGLTRLDCRRDRLLSVCEFCFLHSEHTRFINKSFLSHSGVVFVSAA